MNKLYVYCNDCKKDITLEGKYYDPKGTDKVWCGKCNENYGFNDYEEAE